VKRALTSGAWKAAAVGVIAVGVAAAVWYFRGDAGSASAAGFQTQPASMGRIESVVNASGTINPVVTVEVGSEISGLVSELHADFNSEVKAGDVIARIDDRTLRARLRQTEADVASAHANREQQRANVSRANADVDLARTDVARKRELSARQLVSQAEVEQAEANIKIAEAQLEVAKAQLTAASAAVLQREAQLEQTNLDLERTYIRSPVDGTVIDRQVDVGQTVAASLQAPTLFEIAQDLKKMQIEADIDEADIGQIREGLAARFTVDAHPNRSFDGTVRQVRKAATVTSNVVTYKVIVDAENPEELLLPGMTANVDIVLGIKDGVLRVANSALRFNPPGAEGRAAGGFAPGRMTERLDEIVTQLGLDAKQRDAVEEAMNEFQAAMGQVRDPFAGGPPVGGPPRDQREQMGQLRQRMTNRLSGVLTSEQLARFEQSFGGPPGGPGGEPGGFPGGGSPGAGGGFPGGEGGLPGGGMRPGQVWVLEDGEPRAVRVLVGLSDAQYTEVRSQELADGDAVIVRLAR
jgi:HlyD family secretion protein